MCKSSECCAYEAEVGIDGDCVSDFILEGGDYLCEHGMAGVWNRPCLSEDGSCDKNVCCQKVKEGNCIDNFLAIGKEYLCHGGQTGVLTYNSCKLDSNGECESAQCCMDTGREFSYNFDDNEPDF